ncbi:hypothetical protein [Pseudomonas fluorescens]|uniref:DUF3077 domain-containing protein n=2 Tax=Pseudomonas fluorescens TaxID=294 RepID=A0ABY1TAW2_PSEFL|nr:hypothetical protein [Pseudomonas fluorescens]MCI4604022.1 hypothetical protein [Pseudomonas fluorescens]PQB02148.1 hypothetical protein B0A76_05695 [Pseudomonas fluorescens]RFP95256.1 hypothetical protein D0N73_15625 [Pseudomonas fluorescens]RMO73697.1 hypothetical protein ALQ35_01003 [Pseudomonas fluorescens]TWR47041.1 hypothetical protein FIP59_15410 [Pseudomonas fluorescens]
MTTLNVPANRYRLLRTNFTDTHPLVIDTEATAEDIQSAAHQRIRAASDLLKTFTCLTYDHADLDDISHIINALYLLVQDGCDLLEAAQHVQLQPAADNQPSPGQPLS